jgi:hypothetical protein
MLRWFSRLRKPADKVRRIAARPLWLLESRRPLLIEAMWQSPYCCTMVYFWTALITEQVGEDLSQSAKRKVLQQVFARMVKELGGDARAARQRVLPEGHLGRRRALADLKRVVTLYSGAVDDSLMLYPDIRNALDDDARPALPGNRWGLRHEAAHEILLARYLAADIKGS